MPRDTTTAGYKMTIEVTFTEMNRYNEELSEGTLRFVKKIRARSLTELGRVLARLEKLDALPASTVTDKPQ